MQMITVSHGETMLTTPDAALALQVLTGLSASVKPAAAPSGIPEIGEYWPGEGGVNGGLFPGGDKPYYLIVPIGADAERELQWGGYGDELDGANSPHDGLSNTADLAGADDEYPAAQFCAAFERDGKKDFYLMARREAQFLEITVPDVFSKRYHWTSSQASANSAYLMDFEDGWLDGIAKHLERVVRPVRRKYF
ncbi:hypothetical protein C4K38_2122 [Pseudomonas chlororaphis subsp. piscium]|uniref:hypothetical protein n=1 Tax=Pseudomonas chlororaphis TaxID=587753 RepID=UPI0006A6157E|nr:hypothetical protein [Pseudomonas chlororaphis]AZC30082.1 hypothetical protein C4K38_2122 [Pseudomonas chlororaphis subsp. piscium]WDG94012.1 DUF1566 domain-containing protein [Pseudomonas chlororaphis]SDT25306.1 hypothetical protein SAMN05216585_5255 [Pseudomonas chlororaphis]